MAGVFGTDLYAELEPLAYDDAHQNYALLNFLDAIGSMYDEIESYARDGSLGEPGWSILVDLTRVPEKALPWLGQFVGVQVTEGLTVAQKTSQISAHEGFGRGTPLAIARTIQPYLIGNKTVILRERDTSPYHFSVFTYSFETVRDSVAGAALTLSGNEITDVTRAAGVQGDGRTSDSSYGIWAAATNLIKNGGAETNLTGWNINVAGTTMTRDNAHVKFGSWAGKFVNSGSASAQGLFLSESTVVAANTQYTFSTWVYGTGTVRLSVDERTAGNVFIRNDLGPAVNIVNGWQRLTYTFTTSATTGILNFYVITTSAQAITFWVDGLQVELGKFASPYIQTDGAAVVRNAARVQAPSTPIDVTQGWFAARVRMGNSTPTNAYVFGFEKVAGSTNSAIWINVSDTPNIGRHDNAGAGNGAVAPGFSYVPGDYVTVIGFWTATQIGISINGAAFTSVANSSIPTLPMLANFDIGQKNNANHLNGDVLWAMHGIGTLTDAQAAAIHALGNSDPSWDTVAVLPGLDFFWAAKDASTLVPTNSSAKILAALLAAKPAGLQMSYSIVAGGSYGGLLAGYTSYQSIFTAFTTYRGVLNNAPGT